MTLEQDRLGVPSFYYQITPPEGMGTLYAMCSTRYGLDRFGRVSPLAFGVTHVSTTQPQTFYHVYSSPNPWPELRVEALLPPYLCTQR